MKVPLLTRPNDFHTVGSHHQCCGQSNVAQSNNINHVVYYLFILLLFSFSFKRTVFTFVFLSFLGHTSLGLLCGPNKYLQNSQTAFKYFIATPYFRRISSSFRGSYFPCLASKRMVPLSIERRLCHFPMGTLTIAPPGTMSITSSRLPASS